MLWLGTMGCGRSKNQSPQNGGQGNQDITMAMEKNTKKKKLKGGKKEAKEPPKTDTVEKTGSNNQNLPALAVNGTIQAQTAKEVEVPILIEKENLKASKTAFKDAKAFPGTHSNIRVTNSQIEFFRMLDEKIEQGYDYRSEEGIEILTPSPRQHLH